MTHDDHHDVPDLDGLTPSRRGFLKWAGFSVAATMLPACSRSPEQDAVPFLDKPEGVTPGLTQHYATGCPGCDAGCGLLATVRDGRPIKVEGNETHPLNLGRTCAVGQASVLELYDARRLQAPLVSGQASNWAALDAAVARALDTARASRGAVRVLTAGTSGPTVRAAIAGFLAGQGNGRHVVVDALSQSALLDAHAELYGQRVLPHYRFDKAQALVAVDADFLGTWVSPVEFTRGYLAARNLDPRRAFCHHTHFEARVSLTGGQADRRVRTHPADLPLVLAALAERVAQAQGTTAPWGKAPAPALDAALLDEAAQRLLAVPRGTALVVCGLDDGAAQRITAWLNHALGADDPQVEGRTIDLDRPSQQAAGDEQAFAALVAEMEAGAVAVLIAAGCDPVQDHAVGDRFAAALKKVPTVIAVSDRLDATARAAAFVAPPPHALAAWGDAEPIRGTYTVSQPTLKPLGEVRPFVESLAHWSGQPRAALEQMRRLWEAQLFPRARGAASFEAWWVDVVHDGHVTLEVPADATPAWRGAAAWTAPARREGAMAVVLHPTVGVRQGRHAHNPWLQELPDPVTKVSWDNVASFGPATAARLGVVDGDLVTVGEGAAAIQLPALVQVGQAEETVAIALGYGVLGTDRFARVGPEWIESQPTVEVGGTVGRRAVQFARATSIAVRKAGGRRELARTQIYDRLDVPAHLASAGHRRRPHAQETTLAAYRIDPSSGAPHGHPTAELWDQNHAYQPNHWGMAIDLSRCTGCAACVVACQAENNIPVVGRDEVRRQREMHWLRIDRYFEGDDEDLRIAHQPMMCQHCDHAPCETVCPVLATVHSDEGLNQQIYNRCVGTRYCSNNCPYKVRRFNWFEYRHEDEMENLVLNPDVTVRTRGVMEKCSFCVQRIQERKAIARHEGRPLADLEIQTACMQVCPADAIVFGNTNDKASAVGRLGASPRAYKVLEELNVKPSVAYLRRVADRPVAAGGSAGHGAHGGEVGHD